MKRVHLTGNTLNGAHVCCDQTLEVGERVLYKGAVVTVTEVLHTGEPYKALGEGETCEEMSENARMVQLCYARIDKPLLKRELVYLQGNGLPEGLPDGENY